MICTMATMTGLVDFNQTEVDGAGLSAAAAADRLRSELRSYVANVYRYHRQYIYDVVLYQYRQDKLPPADRNHRHFSDTLVAILGDAQQVNSLASGDLSVYALYGVMLEYGEIILQCLYTRYALCASSLVEPKALPLLLMITRN